MPIADGFECAVDRWFSSGSAIISAIRLARPETPAASSERVMCYRRLMTALVIVTYDVSDPDRFAECNPGSVNEIVATITKHGGQPLAAGAPEAVMGSPEQVAVCISFSDAESAKARFDDEYAAQSNPPGVDDEHPGAHHPWYGVTKERPPERSTTRLRIQIDIARAAWRISCRTARGRSEPFLAAFEDGFPGGTSPAVGDRY